MFENILGHGGVKQYLISALKNHTLHHALLFAGDDGVGKMTLAKQLAKYLLGEKKIDSHNHPDFHIIKPSGKSASISIDEIRTLTAEVYKPPFEAKRKVFIIDHAERLNPASSNALLKTLEEPSLDSTIILLTSKPYELLPTILSRTLRLNFHRLTPALIEQFFRGKNYSPERVKHVAKIANGSLGAAVSLIDHPELEEKRQLILQMLSESSYTKFREKVEAYVKLIEDQEDKFKETDYLFSQIQMFYRDLNLLYLGGAREMLYFPELKEGAFIPLEKVENLLEKMRLSTERHIKLNHALEYFFLRAL